MTNKPSNTEFFSQIVDLLQSARNKVVQTSLESHQTKLWKRYSKKYENN